MKTFDLVLFHDIITTFENNNFKEASILHSHFIKVAQPTQNPSDKEALDIIAEKGLEEEYKNFAIEYFRSQPQFEESDDFEEIFNVYGSNNSLLAEQFLQSTGNDQFIDVQERSEKGEEIVEMLETLSVSDKRINKLNETLKVAIRKGLPVAFVLAGSAKLYYLLKYLIENREEIAKYITVIFGVISSILSSLPPVNFTLFNIQQIPSVSEIVEDRRIINVTRVNDVYRYFIQYQTPNDDKFHQIIIETVDENNDRNTTKLKAKSGEKISEPFTSPKKFKSIKVFDNGKLVDSQSKAQASKQIEDKKERVNQHSDTPPSKQSPTKIKSEENIKVPLPQAVSKPKSKIGPAEEKIDQKNTENNVSDQAMSLTTPTFNNRQFNTPQINVETEPVEVQPSSSRIKPNIPEKREDNKYYLENKPDTALDKPEEFNSKRSRIPGIHPELDDMVVDTMRKHLGENVSLKIHEPTSNEYDDVNQFVEFIFPDKKKNYIVEFNLNGNTGRKSKENHSADFFKKKSRFSLPKVNLDDEQVQGILSGLLRRR